MKSGERIWFCQVFLPRYVRWEYSMFSLELGLPDSSVIVISYFISCVPCFCLFQVEQQVQYLFLKFFFNYFCWSIMVVQSLSHARLFELHGLQHARLPCPSPSPGVCSNSCPLNQWCHPTISFSVASFSSCLQSFSASGSFLMSGLFASGGQSTGASALASSFQWIFRVDFL